MPALALTPTQRRAHRAAAHALDPVVRMGSNGLTPAVVSEIDAALRAHGLIKVRAASEDRDERDAQLHRIAEELEAAAVQHIGKLWVLWRPIPDAQRESDDARGAGPRTVTMVTFSKSGNHRPTVKKVRVLGNQRVTAAGSIKRAKKRKVSGSKKAALS
jgi:RNA-binding protein